MGRQRERAVGIAGAAVNNTVLLASGIPAVLVRLPAPRRGVAEGRLAGEVLVNQVLVLSRGSGIDGGQHTSLHRPG